MQFFYFVEYSKELKDAFWCKHLNDPEEDCKHENEQEHCPVKCFYSINKCTEHSGCSGATDTCDTTTGVCKCGTNDACSGNTPNCKAGKCQRMYT